MENITYIEPINRKSLFREIESRLYCLNECDKAKAEIDRLTPATINDISESQMVVNLYSKYQVEISKISEKTNCKLEVNNDGKIVCQIPFTGNGKIFNFKPSRFYSTIDPYGNIKLNEIIIEYPINDGKGSTEEYIKCIKEAFAENYDNIKKYLDSVSEDCIKNNETMKKRIEKYVKEKYNDINRIDSLKRHLETDNTLE